MWSDQIWEDQARLFEDYLMYEVFTKDLYDYSDDDSSDSDSYSDEDPYNDCDYDR